MSCQTHTGTVYDRLQRGIVSDFPAIILNSGNFLKNCLQRKGQIRSFSKNCALLDKAFSFVVPIAAGIAVIYFKRKYCRVYPWR